MNQEVANTLKDAKLLIEGGWIQHRTAHRNPVTGRISYCLTGAVDASCAASSRKYYASLDFLRMAIRQESAVQWNDAPERTKEEILDALTKAIALAEADA